MITYKLDTVTNLILLAVNNNKIEQCGNILQQRLCECGLSLKISYCTMITLLVIRLNDTVPV